MESNLVWLAVVVLLAIGGIFAQFMINVRHKRRMKAAR